MFGQRGELIITYNGASEEKRLLVWNFQTHTWGISYQLDHQLPTKMVVWRVIAEISFNGAIS